MDSTSHDYVTESKIERTKRLIDFQSEKHIVSLTKIAFLQQELTEIKDKKKLTEEDKKKVSEHDANINAAREEIQTAQKRTQILVDILAKLEKGEAITI